MKRIFTALLVAITCISASAAGISTSKMRDYARFLSDRMAYELDLSPRQYEDCYEINLDFLYAVNPYLDDMVYGYDDAIERYYVHLDNRNDDLRYIMTSHQYVKFMSCEYFYRPIYSTGRDWAFRIHTIYSNHNFFYFDAPVIYKTYVGGHSRVHYSTSYYANRYSHTYHTTIINIHGSDKYDLHRRNDFGTNHRARGGSKYDINNYNNRNQKDRSRDSRYKDNSHNVNSPDINRRGNSRTDDKKTIVNPEPNKNDNGNSRGNERGNTRRSSDNGGASGSRAVSTDNNSSRSATRTTDSNRSESRSTTGNSRTR